MNKGELNRILKGRGPFTPEESTKIRSLLKEIIAQQDYIIIDWGGLNKDNVSKERLAEIKARLRTIKDANPLIILSVVMKNYDDIEGGFDMVTSVSGVVLAFYSGSLGEIVSLNFE